MKRFLCILAFVAAVMSDSDLEAVFKKSNDRFSANMFQEVIKSQRDKSCVLSAFSVLSPLAELALASVGESHDEILKAIGLPNDNVMKKAFSDLNSRLRSVKGVDLSIANKLYVRKDYSVDDEFAESLTKIFNSEIENIDFQQKTRAADEINAWVEDHTHKVINDMVQADSFDENTAAFLVNAIYFKGPWKYPFEEYDTFNRTFYVTKAKTSQLPMMHQTGFYKYAESKELDTKFLQLYYEGDETSFVVALPNKIDGISNLIGKMKDPSILNKAISEMSYNAVKVYLPAFKIETTINLVDILKKMNIKKLFQAKNAKLYKLLKEAKDLYVSNAAQKSFIEVNEKGTEAAVIDRFSLARPSSLTVFEGRVELFKADHPFVFFILERNNILFSGAFRS